MSECFAFSLTTFLCDVAVLDSDSRNEILNSQVSFLSDLTKQITESKGDKIFTKRIIPQFFGHTRAIGRFSSEGLLFLKLFPKPLPPVIIKSVAPESAVKNRSFSSFRSIIPQSLSSTVFANIEEKEALNQKPTPDAASLYFRSFGSSFEPVGSTIQFSVIHLEAILKVNLFFW